METLQTHWKSKLGTPSIRGVVVHPGFAYGKMVNAGCVASEFVSSLPANEMPETTKGFLR